MALPKTTVDTIDAPPVLSANLDSRQAFVAMENFRGTLEPQLFRNGRDVQRKIERSGVGIEAYDVVDGLLREGVPRVWLARIVGPDAASASIDLDGSGGDPSITVTAREPGEWANGSTGGLKAEVTAQSTSRTLNIYRGGSAPENLVASSGSLATRAALVAWGETSTLVEVTLGTENTMPAATSATNLAGGDSDSAGITSVEIREALDRMTFDKGPGQVLIPGRSTTGSNQVLAEHCEAFNRTGLGELEAGLSVGSLQTALATLRALGSGAEGLPRLLGMWAQMATGPGVVGGTSRSVPWTVVVAGQIARLQSQKGHPNVAPVGERDQARARWATGVDRYFADADAETLYDDGLNVVTEYLNRPHTRTFHTLEDAGVSEWVELAHTRLDRAIRADAFDIGREMAGEQLSADWSTINDFGARLRERLESNYRRLGALYGATPGAAFIVDVTSVNDDDTIAAGEVNAAIGVKMSPHAEQVNITITKIPITQALPTAA